MLGRLTNGLFLFDRLQAQLILIRKNRVDSADLKKLNIPNGFTKAVILFSIALP